MKRTLSISFCLLFPLSFGKIVAQCSSASCPPGMVVPAVCAEDACVLCSLEPLNGYTGSTDTLNYCDIPLDFCGTVENNHWFAFLAPAATVSFTITPFNCQGTPSGGGIQAAIYSSTDCDNFTSVSDCMSQGFVAPGNVTATNLTIGQTYYLMIDGWAGDICEYTIEVTEGLGNPVPTAIPVINGPVSFPLATNTYTATYSASVAGGFDFQWSIEPPDAGTYSGPSNSAQVDITWDSQALPGATAQLCVSAENNCGTGQTACRTVILNSIPIPGGSDCATAPVLCDGLMGLNATLPAAPIQQPFPGCPANVINNPLWYGFVAGSNHIAITVTPFNCQGTNGQFGIQGGIYHGCSGSQVVLQCPCTTDAFTLNSNFFVPGETYYLLIDGCAGDICDFTVEVVSGSTVSPNPLTVSIDGPVEVPDTFNNFTATYYASGADFFEWSIEPPGAGSFNGASTGKTVEVTWADADTPTTAQLCAVPSNSCLTGLQSCLTINLDTTYLLPEFSAFILAEAPPAQLDSSLTDLCLGDTLHLTGFTMINGDTVQDDTGFTYTWIFDENETLYGKTVVFAFSEPGHHQVEMSVTIPPGFGATAPVLDHIFVIGTPAVVVWGLPAGPVCPGTEISLFTAPATDSIVLDQAIAGFESFPEGLPLPDGTGASIEVPIQVIGNAPGDVLTSVDNLRICVNMEHSWMRDLEIKVTCPNGQSAILHNHPGQTGGEVFLGEPYESDEGLPVPVPGVGYDYCWTANAPNPTWIEYANANIPPVIPPGDYKPYQPLTNLLGCPIDGEWMLTFTDLWPIDNGHVFSAGIIIDDPSPQYFPIMANPKWKPDNSITTYTDLQITASPDSSTVYRLDVADNYGCGYELEFPVEVLPAGDPACIPCDSLVVELEDVLSCNNVFPFALTAFVSITGSFMEYAWLLEGDTVSNTPEVVIEMVGAYIFIATNTVTGCSVSDTLNFANDTDLPVAVAGPDLILYCQPVTLDGSASSTGPEFAYEWLDVTGAVISNEITATVSLPGVYFLVVTNLSNGCENHDTVVVSEEAIFIDPAGGSTPDSCGLGVGTAFVFFPNTDVSYLWSTGDTTSSIGGLFSGNYMVTVTWQDCDWMAIVTVDSIPCTAVPEQLSGMAGVKILPNPNSGQFSVQIDLSERMMLAFSVTDVLGREVKRLAPAAGFDAGHHTLQFDVEALSDGSYFLKIKSPGGSGVWKFVKTK